MIKTHFEEVREDLKYIADPIHHSGHCTGGYIRHYDTDYECNGCARCREPEPGRTIGRVIWGLAHWQSRQEVSDALRALQALATIGHAVEAALLPGRAMASLVHWSFDTLNKVRVHRCAQVVGRQGPAARESYGQIGYVVTIKNYGDFGTVKAKMIFEDRSVRYIPIGQLDVILPGHEPQWARTVVQQIREEKEKEFTRRQSGSKRPLAKGEIVRIDTIKWPNEVLFNKSGELFWIGVKNGVPRCGVKISTTAVWLDQADVTPIRPDMDDPDSDWPIIEQYISGPLEGILQLFRDFIRDVEWTPRKRYFKSVKTPRGWRKVEIK